MFELDEDIRSALRAQLGPSPDVHARLLASLRRALGPSGPEGGEGGGGPTGGPPGGGGQLLWWAKIIAATAGLTGAGLLSIKLAVDTLRHSSAPPDPASVLTPVSPQPNATPASDPARELGGEPESAAPEAAARPKPTSKPTRAPDTTRTSDLAAELALLDAAERMRKQDPAQALRLLLQHRREFPTGVLAHEREQLRERIEGSRTDSQPAGD